jgi:MYXO-CTERM domain-containing protein
MGPLKTESNRSFNLAAITSLDNAGTVYFRIAQTSATSINGGTVATGGTSRIDNIVISGTAVVTDVPEPSTMILGGVALAGFGGSRLLRRRQKLEIDDAA